MFKLSLYALAAVALSAFTAMAQTSPGFDTSGNAQLNGTYFVREILIAGQNTDGSITQAKSAIGTIAFDGKGGYSFNGQITVSGSAASPQSFTSTYKLAANGLILVTSLLDENDVCYGAIGSVGPSAIVASATESLNYDLLVAIPTGAGVTNGSLSGSYTGASLDFTNASISMVREANFDLNVSSPGSFGTVAASGKAANLGASLLAQSVSGVSYNLTANGSGTINFGPASTGQLLSGTKNFYVSADGNILLGGDPAGFDITVALRSVSGASNSTASGLYFVGGLEDFYSGGVHSVDAFYGSSNANGNGLALVHNRFKQQKDVESIFDWTFSNNFSVGSNGSVTSIPYYSFRYGAGGKAFVATGVNELYSLELGLASKTYSGTGVFINPTGVVNAATFAPVTNPVAPNEIVTLFGSGLAPSTVTAGAVPLPTILGGVQVNVNGTPAPLFYVTPTQIAFLIPPGVSPDFNIYYSSVQVVNNGASSNTVTLFTSSKSPGIFSAGGNGIGPAAATHVNGTLISASNPAKVGETIVVYAGGLGKTDVSVASGAPSPSSPPAKIPDSETFFLTVGGASGADASVAFKGLTPGLSGLYQINATVAQGTPTGSDEVLDVQTADDNWAGVSSQTTVYVNGSLTGGAVGPQPLAARPQPRRVPAISRSTGFPGRSR